MSTQPTQVLERSGGMALTQPAPPLRRVAAAGLDVAVLAAAGTLLVAYGFGVLAQFGDLGRAIGMMIAVIYFVVGSEPFTGLRTLGQRAFGLGATTMTGGSAAHLGTLFAPLLLIAPFYLVGLFDVAGMAEIAAAPARWIGVTLGVSALLANALLLGSARTSPAA